MTDLGRRRVSFGSVAAVYERGRPGYPGEAVTWLAERLRIEPGCDVLDLGAGTGKLTRQLVPLGARVVAVEPLDEMRAERAVPGGRRCRCGRGDPADDGSVDAVTAQAFHWFDPTWLCLRSGGPSPAVRSAVWNTRDSDSLHARSAPSSSDASHDGRRRCDRCGLFGDATRIRAVTASDCRERSFLERVA
jgi:SAM-dependent methyltransferase